MLEPDLSEAEGDQLAREMLALGVIVAGFEARYRTDGDISGEDFHAEWQAAVNEWWTLAEQFEALPAENISDLALKQHAASLARMLRFP